MRAACLCIKQLAFAQLATPPDLILTEETHLQDAHPDAKRVTPVGVLARLRASQAPARCRRDSTKFEAPMELWAAAQS